MEYHECICRPFQRDLWIGTLEVPDEILGRLQRGAPVVRDFLEAAVVRMNRVRPPNPTMSQQVWSDAALLILAEKERRIIEAWGVADVEFTRVQLVGPKNEQINGSFWLLSPNLILDYVDPNASNELRAQLGPDELQTESYLVLRDDVLERSPVDGRDALIRPLGFEGAILFRDDLAAELEDSGLVLAPLSGPLE